MNVLYKFASMILWLVDKKALMMQFIDCKTEKATSLKNISSMQDTGVVTYNRLNFVVVFQGPSGRVEQAGTSTSLVTGEEEITNCV